MFVTDETVEVTLLCDNVVMKSIVDKFGMDVKTKSIGSGQFQVKVKICAGPTFYCWVFGFAGKIRILGSDPVFNEYKERLKVAMEDC